MCISITENRDTYRGEMIRRFASQGVVDPWLFDQCFVKWD